MWDIQGKNRLFEIRLTRLLEVSIVARLKANADGGQDRHPAWVCLLFHLSCLSERPSEYMPSQNEHCGLQKTSI